MSDLNPFAGELEPQPGTAAGALLALFPDDPISTHRAQKGRSWIELRDEKIEYREDMLALASRYDSASRALIETGAELAMLCHFDQVRGGENPAHYTSHLLAVADLVAGSVPQHVEDFPVIQTDSGEALHPAAVAITLALLHDTIEDFERNFRQEKLKFTEADYRQAARLKVQMELSRVIGNNATEELMDRLELLTLRPGEEFATSRYLEGAASDPYSHEVKLADLTHNLSCFPEYTPTYPCITVPGHIEDVASGTLYERRMEEHLITCVGGFNTEELLPWRTTEDEKTVDFALAMVLKNEGRDGFVKLRYQYEKLRVKIASGEFDDSFFQSPDDKHEVLRQIDRITRLLPHTPLNADEDQFRFFSKGSIEVMGDEPVTQLGPVEHGCVALRLNNTPDRLQALIEYAAQTLNASITGYITSESDRSGNSFSTFTMTSLPRRDGIAPLPPSYLIELAERIETLAGYQGEELILDAFPVPQHFTRFRALLGLDEGYAERARTELLARVDNDIHSRDELLDAFRKTIGAPSAFGIKPSKYPDFDTLVEKIHRSSFTVTHSMADVRLVIPGDGPPLEGPLPEEWWTVTPATIIGSSPDGSGEAATWREDAALITGFAAQDLPAVLAETAARFGQARFYLEDFGREPGCGMTTSAIEVASLQNVSSR